MTRTRWRAIAGVSLALLLGLWVSPMSPAAMSRADAALGQGNPEVAVQRYEWIAAVNPARADREEALYRAGMVLVTDLRRPVEARSKFSEMLRRNPNHPRRAEVLEQIGSLLMAEPGRAADAADALEGSVEAAPQDVRVPGRLMLAATARAESGDREAADRVWQRLQREYPEQAQRALLARADMWLAADLPERAVSLYERVAKESQDPSELAVARLGVATCLERLGDLEGALAEFDGGLDGVPEGVVERRAEGLRARILSNGGSK